MDDEDRKWLEIAREAMTDEQTITIHLKIKDAWMLVSAIQLATRHPDLANKPILHWIRDVAQQFIDAICEKHPKTRKPLEMGFDPKRDK